METMEQRRTHREWIAEWVEDQLERSEPDGWWIGLDSDDVVRATRRLTDTCPGCGQDDRPVGPVTWIDDRGIQAGGHDWQHGCGTWHSPADWSMDVSGLLEQRDATDPDAELDRIRDALDAWWAETVREHERECSAIRSGAQGALRSELEDALAMLTQAPDDDGLASVIASRIQASETEPGVWLREDGKVEAWCYDPTDNADDSPTDVLVEVADIPVELAERIRRVQEEA